jgi:hypothetical protein
MASLPVTRTCTDEEVIEPQQDACLLVEGDNDAWEGGMEESEQSFSQQLAILAKVVPRTQLPGD